MAEFFIQEDPSLEHKRQLAQLMMQQGMDSGPIRTNAQSLDRLAKALLGGYQTGQVRRQGEERDRDIAQAFKIAEQDGGTKQLSSLLAGIDPRAAQRVSLQNMQAKEAAAAKKSALEEDRTYTRQTAEDRRLDAFHDKTALGEQTEDRTIAAEDRANAEYDRRKRLGGGGDPLTQRKKELEIQKLESAQVQSGLDAQKQAEGIESDARKAYDLSRKLLANKEGMKGAVGTISGALGSVKQETVDFEIDVDALESVLTLENLDKMTGILSDSDIKLLKAAATGGLNLRQSEERMVETLGAIERYLDAKYSFSGESVQEGSPPEGEGWRQNQEGRWFRNRRGGGFEEWIGVDG